MTPDWLTFFHHSDNLITEFKPLNGKDNFYWCNDSYYHYLLTNKVDRYLYLFCKRLPLDVYFMQGLKDWGQAYEYYKANKERLKESYEGSLNITPLAFNPPILRSPEILKPDVILDFGNADSLEAKVLYPVEHRNLKFKLLTSNHTPIPFNQIPELNKILPALAVSFPFRYQ